MSKLTKKKIIFLSTLFCLFLIVFIIFTYILFPINSVLLFDFGEINIGFCDNKTVLTKLEEEIDKFEYKLITVDGNEIIQDSTGNYVVEVDNSVTTANVEVIASSKTTKIQIESK